MGLWEFTLAAMGRKNGGVRTRRLHLATPITAAPSVCFDLSLSIDLHVKSMERSRERPVAGVTSGLIGHGEQVTWEAWHFGIRWRATTTITEFEPPGRFVDEMVGGPFSVFRHEHLFRPFGSGTLMEDVLTYATRSGPARPAVDRVAGAYIKKLLRVRNEVIRAEAEG